MSNETVSATGPKSWAGELLEICRESGCDLLSGNHRGLGVECPQTDFDSGRLEMVPPEVVMKSFDINGIALVGVAAVRVDTTRRQDWDAGKEEDRQTLLFFRDRAGWLAAYHIARLLRHIGRTVVNPTDLDRLVGVISGRSHRIEVRAA